MERRSVKTNHSKNIELDKQVAEIMGLKVKDYQYKSLDPVQSTIFTSPPSFSTDSWTVNYMIRFMKEKGIEIPKLTYEPEKLAKAIVDSRRLWK
jgi:hypothetical protein